MPEISVVIITLNEEKNIERCIQSVMDIADEIIVIDSFSSDQTEEICNRLGVRFIKHEFEGYIEQKNWALGQATHTYVLSLDADEALSKELGASILHIKENIKYDAYQFNRMTNYCGKWIRHSGWYPDRKLRLADKRLAQWTGINPHDKLEVKPGSSIHHLKGDLLHYSYYSISQHAAQANNFSDITAHMLYSRGKRSSIFNILFNPLIKFVRDYFINMGFLDGYYGFVICKISAHATFLKYIKLRQLRRHKSAGQDG